MRSSLNQSEFCVKREAVMKLQRDMDSFDELVRERVSILRDEMDEIIMSGNAELMESLERAEEDIKNGNVTVCKTGEEVKRHLESL